MGIEVITMNIQRYGKDLWVNKYIYQFCSQNEDFELNKRDDDEGGGGIIDVMSCQKKSRECMNKKSR